MSRSSFPTPSPLVQFAAESAATLPSGGCPTPSPIAHVPEAGFHPDEAADLADSGGAFEDGASGVMNVTSHLCDSALVSLATPPRPGARGRQTLEIIDSILVHASLHTRAKLGDETVNEYAELMRAGEMFPPVTVFEDRSGIRRLSDGFHRWEAAKRAGFTTITAVVRRGERLDALRHGLMANNKHGLRRTHDDKRHAIKLALKEFGNLSSRAVAELCGVHHQLVGKVRSQLGESPSSETRLGRDDKRRRIKARSGASSSTDSLEKVGTQETGDQTRAAIPVENPAVAESTSGTVPVVADERQGTEGRTAIGFPLAEGSEEPSIVLTEGWIKPEWMLQKLEEMETRAKAETPTQQPGCARFQRIFIGLADALNRQVGSAPSAEDLLQVENALMELRNFTVTHQNYQR